MIWQTHSLTHFGVGRTISCLQLTWYWPGLMSTVRRLIKSCEVGQAAKHEGTKAARGKRRLYARRPLQKVAIDLVGPFPATPRGNKWVLVLTNHFTQWQDALALLDATAPVASGSAGQADVLLSETARADPHRKADAGITPSSETRRVGSVASPADEGILRQPPLRNWRNSQHADVGTGADVPRPAGKPPSPPLPLTEFFPAHEHALKVQRKLQTVHETLRRYQMEVRQENQEEPPLYTSGDWVWLTNKRRRRGKPQATGKVCETVPGPKGLGQPQLSSREAGPFLNFEESETEALPRLSRATGASPSHPGAKKGP
ncbi:uncharacterized protein [Watersipora subatra]|uniref:uncharacterized protein n=1 Tax=Watersipora subatra TaxID=2589382 RepID=UPI00355C59D0